MPVDVAPDGVAADHLLLNERYALAVLDVALPRLNGPICWRACARGQDLPVLLLTARTDVADRVKGLNLGRTITSPSRSNWMSWKRAFALLRRSVGAAQPALQYGALTITTKAISCWRAAGADAARTGGVDRVDAPPRPPGGQQLFEQVFTLSDEANPESIELTYTVCGKLQGSDVAIITLRGLGYSLERCNAVV